MAGFYESLRDSTVHNLLQRYGLKATLLKTVNAVFNATTGAMDSPGTDQKIAATIVKGTYIKKNGVGSLVKEGDLQVYMSAKAPVSDVLTANRLQVGKDTYEIVKVEPIDPGGVAVMYIAWVR